MISVFTVVLLKMAFLVVTEVELSEVPKGIAQRIVVVGLAGST